MNTYADLVIYVYNMNVIMSENIEHYSLRRILYQRLIWNKLKVLQENNFNGSLCKEPLIVD